MSSFSDDTDTNPRANLLRGLDLTLTTNPTHLTNPIPYYTAKDEGNKRAASWTRPTQAFLVNSLVPNLLVLLLFKGWQSMPSIFADVSVGLAAP